MKEIFICSSYFLIIINIFLFSACLVCGALSLMFIMWVMVSSLNGSSVFRHVTYANKQDISKCLECSLINFEGLLDQLFYAVFKICTFLK